MDEREENNLSSQDWLRLKELRARFLSEEVMSGQDYWDSSELLSLYHKTFAQRIGWKWNSVLNTLTTDFTQAASSGLTLYDFGCGTGIAAEKFLDYFQTSGIEEVWLWDRSSRAAEFARQRLQTRFPLLSFKIPKQGEIPQGRWALILSHVLTEFDAPRLKTLRESLARANILIWVEPGTPFSSERLIEIRDDLRTTKHIVGPCLHQGACGMKDPKNSQHWCHFFAHPPEEIFRSEFWSRFGREMKIDLRSLPVSYLICKDEKDQTDPNESTSRIIGRPRLSKGMGKFLLCDNEGVSETRLLERENKELFKAFKQRPHFVSKLTK
jgi:SAM-dependent methyltransferase